ncbi:MAG: acyl-CoA dehydrogenase [Rickettsiales bacterium]|nr:acyl-CoA dehydrogenase [Rickettsiales bacterium]
MNILNELVLIPGNTPYLGFITLASCAIFSYKKFPSFFYFIILSIYFLGQNVGFNFWVTYLTLSILLLTPAIRREIITKPLILALKKLNLLPRISKTEKIALTSGSVWVDGQLFSGNPNFKWIFSLKKPQLNTEEKSFLNKEVEEICKMCEDHEVYTKNDLPKKVWDYLGHNKFFGMIIPKKYGGLGFSAYAHSCVIEKLSSRSVPLAITTMVPNSLGPAELLMHYGTKKQQDYYLPRLATGEELPCFALTETKAGSDATSIDSKGILFKDDDGEIKIRLNFSKRYITLGAYATVIGVAFQLSDPDKLLFDKEEIGITCALLPRKTKGIRQGRRHDPLGTPFVNSPINGNNVIVDMDMIIGGQEQLGNGWKMLMECLAAGRGISLPSTASGGSKLVVRSVGAYAGIRKQFGTEIGKFEGIQEVLARIAARTYTLDAMRIFTASSVDSGAKPAVISAIAKYHGTEIFRQNINDGMDIMGGRAIIRGKRNVLANAYFSTPISITVEGANIVTRSLIHFGQGAIMCHPYVYEEITALEEGDVTKFDKAFFAHINHLFSNLSRSILLSLTRGYLFKPFQFDLITKYQRKITWCSATFAFLADVALAKFGGNLKVKEKLNGRFGDVLSAMYLATSILKKYQENGFQKEETDLVEYAIREQFSKAQIAVEGIYANMFGCVGKLILFPIISWARFNAFTCPVSDKLDKKISSEIIKNSKIRDMLTENVFVSDDPQDNLGRIENALKLYEESKTIYSSIKLAIKNKQLPKKRPEDLIDEAFDKRIITLKEKHTIKEAAKAIFDAMEVDDYNC